jgi:hypothetical protein
VTTSRAIALCLAVSLAWTLSACKKTSDIVIDETKSGPVTTTNRPGSTADATPQSFASAFIAKFNAKFDKAAGWDHGTGESLAKWCLITEPAQPGLRFTSQVTGPGVVGTGKAEGKLTDMGTATMTSKANQYGPYVITVILFAPNGHTEQATQTVNLVAGPPPTGSCK